MRNFYLERLRDHSNSERLCVFIGQQVTAKIHSQFHPDLDDQPAEINILLNYETPDISVS